MRVVLLCLHMHTSQTCGRLAFVVELVAVCLSGVDRLAALLASTRLHPGLIAATLRYATAAAWRCVVRATNLLSQHPVVVLDGTVKRTHNWSRDPDPHFVPNIHLQR